MLDRGKRAAITQVAANQAQRLQISAQDLRGTVSTVLMADAMEAVAANPLFKPLIRTRIYHVRQGQLAMKRCIEYCHLGYRGQYSLDSFDAFQVSGIMSRSKNCQLFNCFLHRRINQRTLLIFQSAMDDAMTNQVDGGRLINDPGLSTPKCAKQVSNYFRSCICLQFFF